jgi:hypothetical protein
VGFLSEQEGATKHAMLPPTVVSRMWPEWGRGAPCKFLAISKYGPMFFSKSNFAGSAAAAAAPTGNSTDRKKADAPVSAAAAAAAAAANAAELAHRPPPAKPAWTAASEEHKSHKHDELEVHLNPIPGAGRQRRRSLNEITGLPPTPKHQNKSPTISPQIKPAAAPPKRSAAQDDEDFDELDQACARSHHISVLFMRALC